MFFTASINYPTGNMILAVYGVHRTVTYCVFLSWLARNFLVLLTHKINLERLYIGEIKNFPK